MTLRETVFFTAVLLMMGAAWGVTQPLAKIATSEGYAHFGLIFWQMVIGTLVLGMVSLWRGIGLGLQPRQLFVYVAIALTGTIIPGSTSYQAIRELPAGIMSIIVSIVPMVAFPMALALGLENFNWQRFAGLGAGLAGVALLVLPNASLPEPAMLAWITLALVAPVCYAFEGNYVAKWGTSGLDPIQVLLGASIIGSVVVLPMTLLTGQFISPLPPWSAPDYALMGASVIHAGVYTSYIWLIARAGPVFAVQVSYAVTGFGIFWAMVILDERYSPFIWVAMALILGGVFLVQPRQHATRVVPGGIGKDAGRI